MNIRSKLILAFLAVSMPAMILISLLFYTNQKQSLTRQIFNHLESVASIQQNRICAIKEQNIGRLKLVASRTRLRVLLRDFAAHKNAGYQEIVKQILDDARSAIKAFNKIFILSLDGTVIFSTHPEIIGNNMSDRDFFIRGKREFSTDNFFLDANQNLMTFLSGPLILADQLLGVLVIESGTENLISSVSDYAGLGETGETILARRLKNNDAQLIMPTRFDPRAALRLRIPVQWFTDTPMIQPSRSTARKVHKLHGIDDYRGIPVLAVSRYIEELNWWIAVKIDRAEALAPIVKMRNITIGLIVGATLIIVLFSIFLSKNITRPIIRLTEAARNISSGEKGVVADESTKGEIGILARAFNHMTNNLIQSRKLLEDKVRSLSDREEHIRNLLNSTAEGICGMDKEGSFTFCNPSGLLMLGYRGEGELLGKSIHRMIHHTRPDGSEYAPDECMILTLLENKSPVHADDDVFWRADGKRFWVEYWVYPVIREGEFSGAVITFIDITERKLAAAEKEKLNAQILQMQKLESIGTLAGGIAHDFNNILSAIIGYAELAKMKLSRMDHAWQNGLLKDVNEVIRAGDRAKELVRQILTFSRQTRHVRRPMKIHLIVKEALKLIRASIPSTIEIIEEIDENSGTVLADPTQIHQVLMNLCTNAYHAMRETGGVLTVALNGAEISPEDAKSGDVNPEDSYLTPGSYVKLQVRDTGCGMRRSVLERIFEPYFTTRDQGEGSGMGLALTHGIVKNHDGHIRVSSEPGKGTVFCVYLPRIEPEKNLSEISDQTLLPRGNEHILVVDDEENIVLMEQRLLENLGYQVTATSSSMEALRRFTAGPEDFDLVITDMSMPKMSGADLARKILSVRPDMPIVLCTGFSEQVSEKTARIIGIREYVMKPIVSRQIATLVRRLLDEKKKMKK